MTGPDSPVLAVDVGGTDIKSGLVDAAGGLRDVRRIPTPIIDGDSERTGDAIVDRIADLLPDHASAAGAVVPGWVDDEAGVAVHSENLGLRAYPFRDRLEHRLGIPVGFGHDVRAAGLAEFRLGAAADYSTTAVVPIGTGIAAALFVNGRLHPGGGLAGEIGHTRVADGPDCACGARGCLEANASAAAIARAYTARTGNAVDGARDVVDRMNTGDADAHAVWHAALDKLTTAFATLISLLAPESIVVGGGLAAAGDALFIPLRSRVDAALTFQQLPAIIPAALGPDAGLVGAGLLGASRHSNVGGRP